MKQCDKFEKTIRRIFSFLPTMQKGVLVDLLGRYFYLYPNNDVGVTIGLTTGGRVIRKVILEDESSDLHKRFLRNFVKIRKGELVFDHYKAKYDKPIALHTSFYWESGAFNLEDGKYIPELMGWFL